MTDFKRGTHCRVTSTTDRSVRRRRVYYHQVRLETLIALGRKPVLIPERPPKPKEPNAMVWYFNMQGREVVSINARLEDLATIDAFCKKRNISRSSLMVRAALAFCAIQFRGRHGPLRRGS